MSVRVRDVKEDKSQINVTYHKEIKAGTPWV